MIGVKGGLLRSGVNLTTIPDTQHWILLEALPNSSINLVKKLFVNKYKCPDKRGIRGFPEQII
jgi:hypothetical protein